MNINLDYNGKHYNFDIPKGVKIDYLKELSSKLFKSDKTLLELICNNQKIDGKNDNILIQDLIPEGKNSTVLTVQMGGDKKSENIQNINITNQNKKNEELDIKKIELNKENNNNINKDNDKINKTKINTQKSITNIKSSKKLDINKDTDNNTQIYENRLFIANFITKSNELFAMMKDFNDKVKETDNKLNRKMKNFDKKLDNNIFYYELSLFEKRLIDFQKRQIKYYKELIHILNIDNEETNEPNFDLFYNKILLNNNEYDEDKINKNKNKNKVLPNIDKINSKSVRKVKLNDIDSINTILPMLKSGNKNKNDLLTINDLDIIKNKEENDIMKTIDKIKLSKHTNNIMEKFKIKNLKGNKLSLKTEIKNENVNEDKEIKYQIEDTNNKSKINRNNNKKKSTKISKGYDIKSDNTFD